LYESNRIDSAGGLYFGRNRIGITVMSLRCLGPGEFYGSGSVARAGGGFRFASLSATSAEEDVETHTHATAHFVLVLSGTYITSARRAPDLACAPALVFNPAGTRHRDRFLGGTGRFLAISVSAETAGAARDFVPVEDEPTMLDDAFALHAAHRIERQLRKPVQSPAALEGAAWQLIDALGNRAGDATCTPPGWLGTVLEMIRDSDATRLSVGDLASYVGVHPVHLARVFRDSLGCAPGEYLRGRRLERAANLVGRTAAALADVAVDAGFVDQAHFTRAFRSAFAVTPGVYRQARQVAAVQYERAAIA
jgi:AraC family transcriptional regulator